MGQPKVFSDDIQALRRCIRDLVALSSLSAVWSGYDAQRIAESLANELLDRLHLDFIYVCVKSPLPSVRLEVARTDDGLPSAGHAYRLGRILAPWLNVQAIYPSVRIRNPIGGGAVSIAVTPIGLGGEYGLVVAGSQRSDFATETEALLLTVGANQAALLFGRLRVEAAMQQGCAELEHQVEERVAVLHREMAERRRFEDEARRAQQFALLGRLAAGVSHEIRNPLSAIVLHVDLLEEELYKPSHHSVLALPTALAEIKAQLARLDDLMQDYLSLVRVVDIERTPQHLGAVVQAWATDWQSLSAAHGVLLRLEGLADLGWVELHEHTLRRAVLNLVHNALDAMPQGGMLSLVGQHTASHVRLQVRDTGSGIVAEHLPKIFEPLYSTKPGGTGLGLYIVQEIIAAHRGQVTVDSIRGQGTTVTLTLPRATTAPTSTR